MSKFIVDPLSGRTSKAMKLLCLLVGLFVLSPAHGLVNGQAPAEDDTRFDAVCAFSKSMWLGQSRESRAQHNWFGNAVLIAPDVVLTARHLLPGNGRVAPLPGTYAVRFRRHSDGTLGSRDAGSLSYHHAKVARWVIDPKMDLALGVLEEPVKHIEPVRVLLDAQAMSERPSILAGWGSESKWRGASGPRRELRVGENTLSAADSIWRVDSYEVEPRETPQGERKIFIVDERAVPNMHDSGGSIFVLDEAGEPMLAGIISTYTGGTLLSGAAANGFPLEAATRGGDALLEEVARLQPEAGDAEPSPEP